MIKKSLVQCPKCSSVNYIKDGYVHKTQRYLCKVCHYHFTIYSIIGVQNEKGIKRKALIFFLEGFSYSVTARLLNVSHSSVRNWVKEYGNKLNEIRSDHRAEIITPNELTGKKMVTTQELEIARTKEQIVNNAVLLISTDVFPSFIIDHKATLKANKK